MSFDVSDGMIPLKMPQFDLRDGKLYFLLASLPTLQLDDGDVRLWDAIDGVCTINEIGRSVPDIEPRLRRFRAQGVCEMAPAHFSNARRRVLVIEPHMDDAALSVGGLMWLRRDSCEFCVVSVTGYSNSTKYMNLDRAFFDVPTVTNLRKGESALAMRMLGGRHATLGEFDAPLRYQSGNWTLDWFRRHRKSVYAFIIHASADREIEAWTCAIQPVLATTDAQEIWLPLGVGRHTDHELTRSACLRALGRLPGLEQQKEVYLYQDVPYASRRPAHTNHVLDAISAAGGAFERREQDIGLALEGKLRLSAIFRSQFETEHMASLVREAATGASPSGHGCCELLFKLKTVPGPIDRLAAYVDRDELESLSTKLRAWYPRHRSAKRIRIVALVAVGRWADDMSFLLEAFPLTNFEVYLSERCAGETDRLSSPRLAIRVVELTLASATRQAMRFLFSWPCPLVVLTGEGKGKPLARLIQSISFFSNPLLTLRMNHLVLALRVFANGPGSDDQRSANANRV